MAALKDTAAAKGCTPAQLALAWVHAQGADVVPIPGTTKVCLCLFVGVWFSRCCGMFALNARPGPPQTTQIKNLEANVGALVVSLNAAERDALGALGASAVGDRYSDMSLTYHGKK